MSALPTCCIRDEGPKDISRDRPLALVLQIAFGNRRRGADYSRRLANEKPWREPREQSVQAQWSPCTPRSARVRDQHTAFVSVDRHILNKCKSLVSDSQLHVSDCARPRGDLGDGQLSVTKATIKKVQKTWCARLTSPHSRIFI